MSERKYTDEEIVKAIECCFLNGDCSGCPAEFREYGEICVRCVGKNALEMFNRQNAEIEELEYDRKLIFDEGKAWQKKANALQVELDAMRGAANSYKMHYENAKAEAIKEFAEKLKANMCHGYPYLEIEEDLFRRDVDNLVAEMTEGWTSGEGDSFSQYGGYVTVTAIEEMTEGDK